MAYDPFDDIYAMQRLAQGDRRLDMQEDRYGTQMANQQMATRQRFLAQMMQANRKGAGAAPIQEAIYGELTGGMVPGATRHNELMDRDQFWRGVREQGMEREQPQGLYRVGDEYGFNGQRMGSLSQMAPAGVSTDDYFDQIQTKHLANQEAQMGMGGQQGPQLPEAFRQAAAQQMEQMRRKNSEDFMKGFEARYGVNPGVAFQQFDPATKTGYDPQTGTAFLPSTTKINPEDPGNPFVLPGQSIRIPIAERQAYGQHAAALAGFENEEAMRMADPRYAEIQQLRREKEEAQAEEQRKTGRQRVSAAMHRMRLFNDPVYRAQFFGGMANERTARQGALQNTLGAPQPAPQWMQMNPPISLGF